MRIAVSSQGAEPSSMMDPRFGRARVFVLHDTETGLYEYIDNGPAAELSQGAGIESARIVADAGADVVITGRVGPKAEAALGRAGVAYQCSEPGSVAEVIQRYLQGAPAGSAQGSAGQCATAPQSPSPGSGGQGMGGGRGMGGGGRGGGRGMGGGGRGMGRCGMGGGRGQGR